MAQSVWLLSDLLAVQSSAQGVRGHAVSRTSKQHTCVLAMKGCVTCRVDMPTFTRCLIRSYHAHHALPACRYGRNAVSVQNDTSPHFSLAKSGIINDPDATYIFTSSRCLAENATDCVGHESPYYDCESGQQRTHAHSAGMHACMQCCCTVPGMEVRLL